MNVFCSVEVIVSVAVSRSIETIHGYLCAFSVSLNGLQRTTTRTASLSFVIFWSGTRVLNNTSYGEFESVGKLAVGETEGLVSISNRFKKTSLVGTICFALQNYKLIF